MFPYCREKYCETAFKCSVSLQVVINGGATSTGEQDNEDTELMAIYTTENGIAEKVPTSIATPAPRRHCLRFCPGRGLHLGFVSTLRSGCVCSLYNGNRSDEEGKLLIF